MNKEKETRRMAEVQCEYKAVKKEKEEPVVKTSKSGTSTVANIIIVFLCIVIVVLIVVLIQNIVKRNNTNKEIDDFEVSMIEDKIDLSPDGKYIQDLHKVTLDRMNEEVYRATTTKFEDITDEDKILFALLNADKQNGQVDFSYDLVNREYQNLYGADKDAPKIDSKEKYYTYNEVDNNYHKETNEDIKSSAYYEYRTKVEKVDKNEDASEIYVYDSFVCFDTTGDVNSFGVYKSTDKTLPLETGLTRGYDSGVNKEIFGGKTVEALLDENLKNGGAFKHTFKFDSNNNLYWYSSEYIT